MAKTFEALQQLNFLGQNYFEHIIFDNDEKLKNKNIVIDIDLSECHFDFINFTNIIFRDVNFIDTDFINSYFVNCIFKNCNFKGANFKRVHISNCFFDNCNLSLNEVKNLATIETKSNITITDSQNTEIKIN